MTADRDTYRSVVDDLVRALAQRPECEHGLNGPCSECGPAVETVAVRRATKRLHHKLGLSR